LISGTVALILNLGFNTVEEVSSLETDDTSGAGSFSTNTFLDVGSTPHTLKVGRPSTELFLVKRTGCGMDMDSFRNYYLTFLYILYPKSLFSFVFGEIDSHIT